MKIILILSHIFVYYIMSTLTPQDIRNMLKPEYKQDSDDDSSSEHDIFEEMSELHVVPDDNTNNQLVELSQRDYIANNDGKITPVKKQAPESKTATEKNNI